MEKSRKGYVDDFRQQMPSEDDDNNNREGGETQTDTLPFTNEVIDIVTDDGDGEPDIDPDADPADMIDMSSGDNMIGFGED